MFERGKLIRKLAEDETLSDALDCIQVRFAFLYLLHAIIFFVISKKPPRIKFLLPLRMRTYAEFVSAQQRACAKVQECSFQEISQISYFMHASHVRSMSYFVHLLQKIFFFIFSFI